MLLRIADLNIRVPFDLLEDAQRYCQEYEIRADDAPADIVVERDICELGEQLPLFDRMIVHGVALWVGEGEATSNNSRQARAFIFTAASGVGKSTHAYLWQRLLGEEHVRIINGDKPIVCQSFDGDQFDVYGSPWCGKEGLHQNTSAPLCGIGLLHRGAPSVRRATREEFFDFMTSQTFLPQDPTALRHTFGMLERMYDNVPVYHIYADLSRESVELSIKTLYEDYQRI